MFLKNRSGFLAIIITTLALLSLNLIPALAQGNAANFALNKAKTQMIISQISFENPAGLPNSLEEISQLLVENKETTITLNSKINLQNLNLPMSLQVQSSDTLETLTKKWQEIKISQLQSLITAKQGEVEFLQGPVWNDSNIENILEKATLLANLDPAELEQKIQATKNEDILIDSLTISRSNLEMKTGQILTQIAQKAQIEEEKIDLTSAGKDDTRDQALKPKATFGSTAKIANTTAKFEDYLKQNQQKFNSAALNSSLSGVDAQADRVFSISSNLSSQNSNQNYSTSSSTANSEYSSSSEVSFPTELATNNSSGDNIAIKSVSSSSSVSNNNAEILTVQNILELQVNSGQSEAETGPGINQELTENSISDENNWPKIAKIQTFYYRNPFYVSPQEETQRKLEIETEKNKALEHNKKYKQNYSVDQYQEMLQAGNAPDPSIYPFSVQKDGKSLSDDQIKELQNEAKTAWIGPLLGSIPAKARGLNNSIVPLLIYSWDNPNLTLDLPNGNMNNGTQLGLYGRHGSWNQSFRFENHTNRITINGKCLDIMGSITSGTQIGLWDCHNGDNQKWVFNGTSLKPIVNQNLCLEQSNSLSEGTRINLWGCHGGSNQRWVSGRNDFGYTTYHVSISAANIQNIITKDVGHAFVTFRGNGFLVNTFSSWGYASNDDYNSDNTSTLNNMGDGDNIWVDSSNDWFYANNLSINSFKSLDLFVSKQIADFYRFNSGYRWPYGNITMEYKLLPSGQYDINCAKYSSRLWANIMYSENYSNRIPYETFLPSDIYNAI